MKKLNDPEKQKVLYKTALSVFFTNEIEIDKIILALSIGAIGFYSSLLTSKSLVLTEIMFITLVLSVLLYGMTTAVIMMIFSQNKKLLLSIISTDGIGEEQSSLSFLDSYKYYPFISAVAMSIIFIFALVYTNINKSGIYIDDKNKIQNIKEERVFKNNENNDSSQNQEKEKNNE